MWAGDHGHAVHELAIAWLMAQRPVASVIAGPVATRSARTPPRRLEIGATTSGIEGARRG
jgi:aryl-alcohol dehydrogenase-like predicted oxidoreductase